MRGKTVLEMLNEQYEIVKDDSIERIVRELVSTYNLADESVEVSN